MRSMMHTGAMNLSQHSPATVPNNINCNIWERRAFVDAGGKPSLQQSPARPLTSPVDHLYGAEEGGSISVYTQQLPFPYIRGNKCVDIGLAPETVFDGYATACAYKYPYIPEAMSTLSASVAPALPTSSNISGQMTVFYAGTVSVYDNVPQAKAEAIMKLAGTPPGARDQQPLPAVKELNHLLQFQNSLPVVNAMFQEEADVADQQEFSELPLPCQAMVPAALPLARKVSLARFLKRRERRLMAFYSVKERYFGSDKGVNSFKARDHEVLLSRLSNRMQEGQKIGSSVFDCPAAAGFASSCHLSASQEASSNEISESGSTN